MWKDDDFPFNFTGLDNKSLEKKFLQVGMRMLENKKKVSVLLNG